jgi:iron complex outermembrane receptor protein
VINKADPVVAGGRASGRIAATDWFQPTVGAAYKVGQHGELYAGFAQSTRAYQSPPPAGLSPPRRPGSTISRAAEA